MKKFNYNLLLLLLMLVGGEAAAQNNLKVISYNILEGMVRDTTKGKEVFAEWVKSQNPDIMALQECNRFTQVTLEELAHSYGHPYAVLLREKGYPVALTSKYPIVNVSKVTDNMHHGFITARIKDMNVLVLHFSPHKYKKRREEVEVVLSTIAASPSMGKWVVMGDFNSESPLDKDRYADGKRVAWYQNNAKKYSFHDNLVDGKYIDYQVHNRILGSGLMDAGKLKAPAGEPKADRIDYIYVSKELISSITTAHFIRDDFTARFSDHKPVVMEINY